MSPEAITAIIKKEMEDKNVKVEDIPTEPCISPKDLDLRKSKRYYDKEVFAWFACPNKDNYWRSVHAWCVIDLQKQTICYRYKQGCQECEAAASPEFPEEIIIKLAKFAVKWFLILTDQLEFDPPGRDNGGVVGGGPHDEKRCEKCKKLGHCCWK